MRRTVITVGFALLVAALAGSVLIWIVGKSPLDVYGLLLRNTWGSPYGIGEVLFKATPLILTGLSVAVAFKVGLFNIGAEGQYTAGSFAMALCGAALPPGLPGPIAVTLCVIAGMLTGALLAGLVGVLKVRYGAHEVINTIMLNIIVSAVILWVGNTRFFVKYTVHTAPISDNATLRSLGITGSHANTSLLIAIGLAAVVAYFFGRTRRGFEWRAVGLNARAAENGGVQLARAIVGAMAVSGALAGAVGANYVLGDKGYYERGIGTGVGFMGIAVALLGRGHPAGIVAAALFLGTLEYGGLAMSELVPKELFRILEAVMILTVVCASARPGRVTKRGAAAPPARSSARSSDGSSDTKADAAERKHG